MMNIYELIVYAACDALIYPLEGFLMTVVNAVQNVISETLSGLFNR